MAVGSFWRETFRGHVWTVGSGLEKYQNAAVSLVTILCKYNNIICPEKKVHNHDYYYRHAVVNDSLYNLARIAIVKYSFFRWGRISLKLTQSETVATELVLFLRNWLSALLLLA